MFIYIIVNIPQSTYPNHKTHFLNRQPTNSYPLITSYPSFYHPITYETNAY